MALIALRNIKLYFTCILPDVFFSQHNIVCIS